MKRSPFSPFILVLAALLIACSAPDQPAQTVDAFVHAVAENDLDKALDLFALEGIPPEFARPKFQMIMTDARRPLVRAGGLKSITSKTTRQDDNSAQVTSKVTYGNGNSDETTFDLVKEEGRWKLSH